MTNTAPELSLPKHGWHLPVWTQDTPIWGAMLNSYFLTKLSSRIPFTIARLANTKTERSRSHKKSKPGRNPSREVYKFYFPSEAHSTIMGKLYYCQNVKIEFSEYHASLKQTLRFWQLPNSSSSTASKNQHALCGVVLSGIWKSRWQRVVSLLNPCVINQVRKGYS